MKYSKIWDLQCILEEGKTNPKPSLLSSPQYNVLDPEYESEDEYNNTTHLAGRNKKETVKV